MIEKRKDIGNIDLSIGVKNIYSSFKRALFVEEVELD